MNAHARFLPLRRSLYGQLTFTFLSFAALFLLLWGSYDLYRSSQSMEQQILDSSTELVNQADGTLSRSMNNLSVMLNSTLMSSDVVRLAISPDLREFENMKAVTTALQNAVAASPLIDSAFLYSPRADLGLSSDYTLTNYQDYSYAAVLARFQTRKSKLTPYIFNDFVTYFYTENNDIYLIQAFSDIRSDRCSCYILFYLDSSQLLQLINSTSDDSLRFYNNAGQRMFASSDQSSDSALLKTISQYSQNNGSFLYELDGGRSCHVVWRRTPYLDWVCLYMTHPVSTLVARYLYSDALMLVAGGILGLSILLMAFFSARRISQPFTLLVQKLNASGQTREGSQSEWEYLDSTYSHLLSQKKELEHYLPLASDVIHEQLFQMLLNGDSPDPVKMSRQLQLIGSRFVWSDPCQVILYQIQLSENHQGDSLAQALAELTLQNKLEQLPVFQGLSTYFTHTEENTLCLICQFSSQQQNDQIHLVQRSLQEFKPENGIVFWGFGSIVPNLSTLSDSLADAHNALYFYACSDPYLSSSAESFQNEVRTHYIAAFRNLLDSAQHENTSDAENGFCQLLAQIEHDITDSALTRSLCEILLEMLQSRLQSLNISWSSFSLRDYSDDVLISETRLLCSSGLHLLHTQVSSRREQYVLLAQEHIRSHYTDASLSLESTAEHIGINTAYLSRIFKSTTSENFITYLNTCRVENACRLLASTDLPAQEVGFLTGFCSAATFFRVFKKHTGMTPIQYRKSAQEDSL